MLRIIPVLVSAALATLSLAAEAQQARGAMGGMGGMGGSRLGGYTELPPAGKVPDHPLDVVLGRPTDDSVTVSVLVYDDREAYVAYGSQSGDYDRRTDPVQLAARQRARAESGDPAYVHDRRALKTNKARIHALWVGNRHVDYAIGGAEIA